MIGMVLRSGIPRSSMVTLSWMRPPSTSVWLLTSTTDVSASRLMNDGELVGWTLGPIEFTSCFTSSATVPSSPMRGVTVRITPASRYSTVWLSPAVVVVVVVVLVAAATWPVVWLVTTGAEVETLMTAFLFSDVSTCGFETMLILFSLASALSIAMNWSVENVNAVSPCPRGPTTEAGPPSWDGSDRVPPAEPGVVGRRAGGAAGGAAGRRRWRHVDRRRRRRRRAPARRARAGRGGARRAAALPTAAVDRVQGGGEVLRLGVLGVVDEHAAAAVDVDVELADQAPDGLHFVLLGVHDDRVRAALRNDQRRALGRRPGRGLAPARRPGGTGRGSRRQGWRRRGAGRGRAQAAAGEELGEDRRQLGGVGVDDRDDLQLLLRHLHVDQADDFEEPLDVRRGVRDDQHVRLAMGDQGAPRRDERPQQRAEVGDRGVLERHDLRDDLVGRATRIGHLADDRRHGPLARALDADDRVEVARLDRREAVHLEDREQDAEHLFLRDPARGLHRHLAAHVWRQHVVEADDLARGLEDRKSVV